MAEHSMDPSGQDKSLSDTISEKTKLPLGVVASLSIAMISVVVAWVETRMTVSQLSYQVAKHAEKLETHAILIQQGDNRLVRIEAGTERIEKDVSEIKLDLRKLTDAETRSAGGRR